jgi:hypothetical protein
VRVQTFARPTNLLRKTICQARGFLLGLELLRCSCNTRFSKSADRAMRVASYSISLVAVSRSLKPRKRANKSNVYGKRIFS